jgi:hypothetical protein
LFLLQAVQKSTMPDQPPCGDGSEIDASLIFLTT